MMWPYSKKDKCGHKRGDYIHGWWLCADCLQKLGSRPVKYGMSTACINLGDGKGAEPRQVILWQASVAVSKEGVRFSRFVMMVAERFVRKGKVSKDDAIDLAISAMKGLRDLGDAFGDADFSWDKDAAYSIADEEMSYWEEDSGECNS